LYQQGACASSKSVIQTNWRPYGLSQSQGALPQGPLTLVISLVSVWPSFTSEAKEAIAHYPEIIKEMKLALQEAGRKLGSYVNKKRRVADQQERMNIFENYIPEVADALSRLSGVSKEKIVESMQKMLTKNKEYIAAHKEAHKVEPKETKEKEGQVRLSGFEDE
jgi:DNA topoisomerase-6 subunit B